MGCWHTYVLFKRRFISNFKGNLPADDSPKKAVFIATKIPQNPQIHFEEILADADLDYLGSDDFFEIGEGLFRELVHFKAFSSGVEWNQLRKRFFKEHSCHIQTAKKKRNKKTRIPE